MRAPSFFSPLLTLVLSLPVYCVPQIPDDALVLLPIHIRDFEAASGIERRSVGDYSALNLRPHVPLVYGRDNLLANLTLYAPDGHQVVSLEEFDDLTESVDCKGDDGSLSLTLKSPEAYDYACKTWSFINDAEEEKFLLIANHKGCGPDDQRQPYWIVNVDEEKPTLTIRLTANIAQWEDVAGTFDMDFGKAVPAPKAPSPGRKEKRWGIGKIFKQAVNDVSNTANTVVQAVAPPVEQAVAAVAPVVDQAAAVVAPVVDQAAAVVAPVVDQAAAVVAPVVDQAAAVVAPVVDQAAAVVAPVVDQAVNAVVDAGSTVVDGATPVVNAVVDAGANVVNGASPVVDQTVNAVVDAGTTVVNGAAPVVAQVATTAGNVVNDAANTAGQAATVVADKAGQVAAGVVQGGGQVANTVGTKAGQIANDVGKKAGQVANDVGKTTGQVAQDTLKTFKSLGNVDTGRQQATVDAVIGKPGVRTNIIKSDSIVVDCVNCYIKGTFEVAGRLRTKEFTILDLILETTLVNVFAVLRLQATITAGDKLLTESQQTEFLAFGFPGAGIAIPGIFSIGATAAYSVGAESAYRGKGVVDFGLTAGIPNNARVLTNARKILESQAINFAGAPITPIFELKSLTGDVSFTAFSIAKISFGVEIAQIGRAQAAVLFKIPVVTAQLTAGFSKTGFCSGAKGASTTGVRLDSKYDFNINTAWQASLGPVGTGDVDVYGITQPLLTTCYELPIPELAPPVGARFRRT